MSAIWWRYVYRFSEDWLVSKWRSVAKRPAGQREGDESP